MKRVLAVILILAVVGGGIFLLANNNSSKNDNDGDKDTTSASKPTETSNPSNSSANQSSGSTITYGPTGFSPSSITVKSGTTVTIKNNSSRDMQFDSDPHPAHTDDEELNAGPVASGESQTFTVTKKGTFGYHNHLNPSDTGKIIVE